MIIFHSTYPLTGINSLSQVVMALMGPLKLVILLRVHHVNLMLIQPLTTIPQMKIPTPTHRDPLAEWLRRPIRKEDHNPLIKNLLRWEQVESKLTYSTQTGVLVSTIPVLNLTEIIILITMQAGSKSPENQDRSSSAGTPTASSSQPSEGKRYLNWTYFWTNCRDLAIATYIFRLFFTFSFSNVCH